MCKNCEFTQLWCVVYVKTEESVCKLDITKRKITLRFDIISSSEHVLPSDWNNYLCEYSLTINKRNDCLTCKNKIHLSFV